MLISSMILLTSLISISTKNILSMWYFMEMSSFMFIFFLTSKNNPTKSFILYFVMSFISSTLMFTSIAYENTSTLTMTMKTEYNLTMVNIAFLVKLGSIPFHPWVFMALNNMEWMSIMILMSYMKIIPIWAIMCFPNYKTIMIIMMMNILIMPWIPMKSKNSFFLLAISSVVNSTWIVLSTINSIVSTILFSISYFLMNSNFIFFLKKSNSKSISFSNPVMMMISLMGIMGFPPLPNFFTKILIMKEFLFNQLNFLLISMLLLISNMISTIMYIKFIMLKTLKMKKLLNWKTLNSNTTKTNMFMNLNLLMLIFLNTN